MLSDPLLKTLRRSQAASAAVGFGAGDPDLRGTEAAAGSWRRAWVERIQRAAREGGK